MSSPAADIRRSIPFPRRQCRREPIHVRWQTFSRSCRSPSSLHRRLRAHQSDRTIRAPRATFPAAKVSFPPRLELKVRSLPPRSLPSPSLRFGRAFLNRAPVAPENSIASVGPETSPLRRVPPRPPCPRDNHVEKRRIGGGANFSVANIDLRFGARLRFRSSRRRNKKRASKNLAGKDRQSLRPARSPPDW